MPAKKKSQSSKWKINEGSARGLMNARDKTEDFIKEHPLTAIAIAAGVGAIVALGINALNRRRDYEPSFLDRLRDYFD